MTGTIERDPMSCLSSAPVSRLVASNVRSLQSNPLFGSIIFALALLFSTPAIKAALPPPAPDGGYPGENTAEGSNALFSLTTGTANTAIGFSALNFNTSGNSNTALGFQALARVSGAAFYWR